MATQNKSKNQRCTLKNRCNKRKSGSKASNIKKKKRSQKKRRKVSGG